MSDHNRPVWSEGLFLRPQHFQQQQRHFDYLIQSRSAPLCSYPWGVTHLELDEAALEGGKISVLKARGVFPDGTAFDIPEVDPAPTPIEVRPDTKAQTVLLCLQAHQPQTREVGAFGEDSAHARYLTQERPTHDTHSPQPGEAQSLDIAVLALSLRYQPEQKNGAYVQIPICHVVERQNESAKLDDHFIPSTLRIGSSTYLQSFCRETRSLIQQRANFLAQRMGTPGSQGALEIVHLLLLQLLNRAQPLWQHFCDQPNTHPESLYTQGTQLLSELCTLSEDTRRPPEIPAYQHSDLKSSFEPLYQHLRKALNWIPEMGAEPIEVVQKNQALFVADVADKSLLSSCQFILAVGSALAPDKVRAGMPPRTTIACESRIQELVSAHSTGVRLKPLEQVPNAIHLQSGQAYFELEQDDTHWQYIQHSGRIGFHIAVAVPIPELRLTLWVVKR